MVVRVLSLILAASLLAAIPEVSFAQAKGGGSNTEKMGGPKKQLSTIVFAGIAGAILGLSTLSFYGRPQDKLSNIAIGFAIGVIGGAVYTTYKAASAPRDFYRGESQLLEEQFRDQERRYARGSDTVQMSVPVLSF
jgi:uncharacterized membrane protein YebE (DUF533 family)